MILTQMCSKITDLGRHGQRTLKYYLTTDTSEDGCVSYGAGIEIDESGENTFVRCITANRNEACSLIDTLATNFVTPVSLGDIVYDWLCR